jgi:UDP-glucose 4-epimerase
MLRAMADKPLVAFGDGTQTRDFTYVRDTARGILLAGFSDRAVGETINLGSGREITINDLAALVIQTVGSAGSSLVHDRPRPGDVLRLYADATRARDLLGFEPQVGFEQGLCELRDWYKSRGQAPEVLLEQEIVHNWTVK